MTESRNSLSPDYQLHWYVIQQVLGLDRFIPENRYGAG